MRPIIYRNYYDYANVIFPTMAGVAIFVPSLDGGTNPLYSDKPRVLIPYVNNNMYWDHLP